MTREEFIKRYAEASGIDVEYLLTVRRPVPCDCGESICEGWAMVPVDYDA